MNYGLGVPNIVLGPNFCMAAVRYMCSLYYCTIHVLAVLLYGTCARCTAVRYLCWLQIRYHKRETDYNVRCTRCILQRGMCDAFVVYCSEACTMHSLYTSTEVGTKHSSHTGLVLIEVSTKNSL